MPAISDRELPQQLRPRRESALPIDEKLKIEIEEERRRVERSDTVLPHVMKFTTETLLPALIPILSERDEPQARNPATLALHTLPTRASPHTEIELPDRTKARRDNELPAWR
jgi:hypothetical protein